MEQQENPAPPKELRDDSLVAGICVVFGTILVGILASMALVAFGKNFAAPQTAKQSPSALRWVNTEPELLTPTREDVYGTELTDVRKVEEERLQSYGWVDPKLKVIRVPIDKAMEILLKQDQPEPAPNAAQPKDERKP